MEFLNADAWFSLTLTFLEIVLELTTLSLSRLQWKTTWRKQQKKTDFFHDYVYAYNIILGISHLIALEPGFHFSLVECTTFWTKASFC
jgi:hypothetical protein